MTRMSISTQFQSRPASRSPFIADSNLNPNVFLRRMERLRGGGAKSDAGTPKATVQFSDAKLLLESEALENAWRFEVAALMIGKRLGTAEAAAVAKRARAATVAVVRRIERAKASTLAGLQVKARAVLWRRNGEPLEADGLFDAPSRDEQTDVEMSSDRRMSR
jgi:hypothetical protein